ncbi:MULTISPECIES: ExbD/TolR family protein [unclassified Corallococcus]|uniref:ExbD/TolR family protein n=1 Tax=unclassified Corallococcus TaxID=2685029 RepID=UPI001A8FA639|nr:MULTISPECIES: biopolymer transporter ExbD [unclassified Corallococcus]MBN9682061.1 biopolymer transporter ExbD [Corallococcus sp. NCSPR001]WAS86377.1 biopolymer transporter ExbD [Corallococcus sp. NCRR]
MGIKVPGKRYGKRLEHSKVFGHGGHGKKNGNADLLITPLVDMFVIIVLFLIANFSATGEVLMMTKDIVLPEAVNVKEVEMHPVVMVSNDQVSVSGTIVGRVEDLTKDEYLNIPALEEKLRDMKKQFEDLHSMAGGGETFKGDVNIQANKDVQFKIIKRVMFSCATAGYGNINFAVIQAGGAAAGEKTAAVTP